MYTLSNMDVSDPNGRDSWFTQNHWQALSIGVAVAAGVSGYYYQHQRTQAIANCKMKDADFSCKTVVITGANTGIGFAAAEQFAELGAKVVLACRDPVKGHQAVERIKARNQNAQVVAEVLDVSNLESIQRFSAKMDRCHVLVNNAGALYEAKELLSSGIEKTFMTNYVGPWYLTRLMLPTLAKTSVEDQCETKVLVVGSRLEKSSELKSTFATDGESAVRAIFKGPTGVYRSLAAYANSKLGNILMSYELARRLDLARSATSSDFTLSSTWRELIYYDPLKTTNAAAAISASVAKKPATVKGLFAKPPPSTADPYDSSFNAPLSASSISFPYITVNALTPGMVATDISRDVHKTWLGFFMRPVVALTWKHPTEGGSEIVYAASQTGVSGRYFGEHKEVESSAHAKDPVLAKALWKVTESVVHHVLTHAEQVAELREDGDD